MAEQVANVPLVKFSNGIDVPILGLGTWKSAPGEVTQAVKDAIDADYRHIDGAMIYENEKEVGVGINAKIDEGVVTREELFLVSKLWNHFHRSDLVAESLKNTLSDLGVEYIDLYLIHWPHAFKEGEGPFPVGDDGKIVYSDVDYVDTWKAMEECVTLGLAKSIGVSNFNSEQIDRILESCTIKPVTNQVECNPYFNQRKLVEFCRSRDIIVTGYSPFGSPDSPFGKPDDPKPLEDPKLAEIGNKYGKSPAQVVIRWQIQRGIIVIPKSVNKQRIAHNMDVHDFALSEPDMDEIYEMDRNFRGLSIEMFSDHKYFPFHAEF